MSRSRIVSEREGYAAQRVRVPYEFQRNGNEMLRII